jgi:hypothetical protein
MEKHYTHKNVSSIRKQRERERVHFFYLAGDRTGCQICQRNKIAGQRERRMAVSHTHTHTQREREYIFFIWPETELAAKSARETK